MTTLSLHQLWISLRSLEWPSLLLLFGAVALAVALIVLLWTRWGHSQSLEKCVLFSILAHLLLTGYATTVQFATYRSPPREQFVRIALVDGPAGADHGQLAGKDPAASPLPPELPSSRAIPGASDRKEVQPKGSVVAKVDAHGAADAAPKGAAASQPAASALPIPNVSTAAVAAAMQQIASQAQTASWQLVDAAEQYLTDLKRPHGADPLPVAAKPAIPLITMTPAAPIAMSAAPTPRDAAAQASAAAGATLAPAAAASLMDGPHPLPETYKLRLATDHLGLALAGGGSKETEAAVQAALKWLAENQNADGRWEARRHEAGRETRPDGRSRPNAGADADTGMTGLALLALLGSGNTHLRGDYRESVRRGLNFLMQSQAADGSLSGGADRYAAMYCHGIATFALGEAYGMTGERRLEQPLRRAIAYTLAAQDPYGGGWRCLPHDAGDTSQLGWQFMSLKSAALAGIPTPDATRQGIIRYLQSVASQPGGGLASYRPGEPPSRTMTAEAMLCWLFLGIPREHPACDEAANFLLSAPPGTGPTDFYYWYYGTFVMYQLQGEGWQRWNTAMAARLVGLQVKDGPLAGSWNPDSAWGGYGGRVYNTALGAMCLEVYYRFLPVYKK